MSIDPFNGRLFGMTWEELDAMQRTGKRPEKPIDLSAPGDYGADPLGDGTFRMVPSGDIVDFEERCKRLGAT